MPVIFILIILAGCVRKESLPDDGSCSGWMVGNSHLGYGTIFYTVNDGFYWQREGYHTTIPDVNISDVSARTATEAWICGPVTDGYGLILYTEDGGKTWGRKGDKTLFLNIDFLRISAKKSPFIWTLGTAGWIGYSSDKGNSWTKKAPDSLVSYCFQDITSTDSGHIWVTGIDTSNFRGGHLLLYSADCGNNWVIRHPESPSGAETTRVFSINDTLVWFSAGNWLSKSMDGGETWQKVLEIDRGSITGISAFNEKVIWVITSTGSIQTTDDAGRTFGARKPFGLDHPLSGITLAGSTRIWITGTQTAENPEGIILYSRNRGATWYLQNYPGVCGLNNVSFGIGNK